MDFLQKEEALIKKLNDTNYAFFDSDKDDGLDFITSRLMSFPNYSNIVTQEQIMMPIWRNRFEGQDLRDKIQDIDTRRRSAHENAISSVNALNRLSKNLGLEPFAEIDTTDRHEVAKFVGQYVNEVYNRGIGNDQPDPFYEATKQAPREGYNQKNIKDRMQKLDAKFGHLTTPQTDQEQQLC